MRPDALVLAEHGHDASGDLDGDGWHGTMNYYGFSFPLWEWLRDPRRSVPSFGLPVDLPRRDGVAMVAAMRDFTASFGWQAVNSSWNILGSHDSPRIRTTTGSADLHHLAAVLQFTLPGVPMVFAGDELGFEGTDGEDSRRTMPWDDQAAFTNRTA
ncbi:MAG: alpha-amylase family glycosyl hydrolase, partial [Marmoricola sp.]